LKFVETIQSDLGFSTHKHFTFRKSEIVYSSGRPASNKGRARHHGRWVRDAVDAVVSLDLD